jgi:polyisoprenyl-teichoic acid--peptidoglycan teichoic acid transferase
VSRNHLPRRQTTARERVAARRASLRRAQRRQPWPWLLLALACAGLLLFSLIGWARGSLQAFEQADPRRPTAAGAPAATALTTLRDPFTVLLLGVDRREDMREGVRSDTLILVYVHPGDGWAGMLAIPRDSVATIPNLGQRKINAAYSYGYNNAEALYGAGTDPASAGGALAAETVEGFLGVPIDHIAQIDFAGFEQIVDTLGGIPVDVPQPLLDGGYPTEDYGYERIYVPAGLQVLDGATALRYARSRHSSSDFDRSARQQQVLRAMLAAMRSRGLLDQATLLPQLARDLEQYVSTTLPLSDLDTLRSLADLAQRLDSGRILTLSINPNDVAVRYEDGSDIYWDEADLQAQVARLLAGPDAETARIRVLNGANVQGVAGRMAERLRELGFAVEPPGDAPAPVERTYLIDYSDRPQTRQRIADALGLPARQIFATPPPDAPAPDRADLVLILGADYAAYEE